MILKVGVIDHDLQGHLAIWTQNSKKQHSSSLFYTNLGRPRGIAHPKRAFVSVIWMVVPVYLRDLCFILCCFLLQVIVWPSWVPAFSCVKLCRTLLITTRTSRLATASPCAMRRYLGPLVTSPKPCCSMKWWTVWLGPADSWHWTLDTWNTGRSRYLLESIVYLFQIQKNYVIIITFCIVHFPFYFSSFFLFGSGMRGVGWEGGRSYCLFIIVLSQLIFILQLPHICCLILPKLFIIECNDIHVIDRAVACALDVWEIPP